MRLQGCPEGRYRLMGRHRMGVHVGGKTRPALAVMTIDSEDDSYALLEARFDFAKKECIWKRTRLETIAPATLRSPPSSIQNCGRARAFYPRDQYRRRAYFPAPPQRADASRERSSRLFLPHFDYRRQSL